MGRCNMPTDHYHGVRAAHLKKERKEDMAAPTIGRIVHYILSESDTISISRRRVPGVGHTADWPAGAQAHVGNSPMIGQHVPMIICTLWPNEFGEGKDDGVNGQAFLDGTDVLWITSAREGIVPGTWHWPEQE